MNIKKSAGNFCISTTYRINNNTLTAERIKIKSVKYALSSQTDLQVGMAVQTTSPAIQIVTRTDGKTNEQKCVLECKYAL